MGSEGGFETGEVTNKLRWRKAKLTDRGNVEHVLQQLWAIKSFKIDRGTVYPLSKLCNTQ